MLNYINFPRITFVILVIAISCSSLGVVVAQEIAQTFEFGEIRDTILSPDKTRIAVAGDSGVWVYETDSLDTLVAFLEHPTPVESIAFTPDGRNIIGGARDHKIYIWNIGTQEVIGELNGHEDWVLAVDVSADGRTVVSSGLDRTIRLWNLDTQQQEGTLAENNGYAFDILFSGDGSLIYAINNPGQIEHKGANELEIDWELESSIQIWDVDSQQMETELVEDRGLIYSIDTNEDDTLLAVGGNDGTVRVWDLNTEQIIQTIEAENRRTVRFVQLSDDGQRLVFTVFIPVRTHVHETITGEEVIRINLRVAMWSGVFGSDTNEMYLVTHLGIAEYNLLTKEPVYLSPRLQQEVEVMSAPRPTEQVEEIDCDNLGDRPPIRNHMSISTRTGEKLAIEDLPGASSNYDDLVGADLRGVDFSETIISHADLRCADLSGAIFRNTLIESTNLSSANMQGAQLENTIFSRVDLSCTDFGGVDLNNSSFSSSNFTKVIEETNVIECTDLSSIRFDTGDFRHANLQYANLSNADLSNVDFSGVDLRFANLNDANLSGASLYGATLTESDLSGADLSGARVSTAQLDGADLQNANLMNAFLFRANLNQSDLSRANLRGVDLRAADLSNAALKGTDLMDATFFSYPEDFGVETDKKIIWETILPNGEYYTEDVDLDIFTNNSSE